MSGIIKPKSSASSSSSTNSPIGPIVASAPAVIAASPKNKTVAYLHDARNPAEVIIVPATAAGWIDETLNANTLQNLVGSTIPSYSATGLNGYGTVVFATNKFLLLTDNATLNSSNGVAIFAVAKIDVAPTTTKNIISKTTGATVDWVIQVDSTRKIFFNYSPDGTFPSVVSLDTGFTATIGTAFIVEVCYNTRNIVVYINGTQRVYSATGIFDGTSPLVYGDASKDGTISLSYSILFTKTLTASERASVRLYLSQAFDIAVQMPAIVPTIIETGQSNEVGKGPNASAPNTLVAAVANAYTYNPGASATQQLLLGTNNQGDSLTEFGPEMETGRVLALGAGKRVMLIKYAVSGAHLANDTLATSFYPSTGTLWTNLVNSINTAFDYERANGRECELIGFSWFQGEGDMIGVTAGLVSYALSYQANHQLLIDTLRSYCTARGYGSSTTRFLSILSAIAISPYTDIEVTTGKAKNVLVNNATIASSASKTNAVTMSITDIATFLGDNIHLDAKAQVLVGARRALRFLS